MHHGLEDGQGWASPIAESGGTSEKLNGHAGSEHFSSGMSGSSSTPMRGALLPGPAPHTPLLQAARQMSVPSMQPDHVPTSPSARHKRFADPRHRRLAKTFDASVSESRSLTRWGINGTPAEEDPLMHVTVDDVMNELHGDNRSGDTSPFAAAAPMKADKAAWMKRFVLSSKNLLVDKGKVVEKKLTPRSMCEAGADDNEFWYYGGAASPASTTAHNSSNKIKRTDSGGKDPLFNVADTRTSSGVVSVQNDDSLRESEPKAALKSIEDAQPTQKQVATNSAVGKLGRRLSQNFFPTETKAEKLHSAEMIAAVVEAANFTFDSRVALRNVSMQLREDSVSSKSSSRSPPLIKTVRALLGSDRSQSDIINLIFSDPSQIKKEINRALQQQAREDREMRSKRDYTTHKVLDQWLQQPGNGLGDEDVHGERKALGFGLDKELFEKCVKNFGETRGEQEANQFVIARLFETVKDVYSQDGSRPSVLSFMNFYTCLDPDGKVMVTWTFIYVFLILYIATVGLFLTTFESELADRSAGQECPPKFDGLAYFDAVIDGFFVLDFIFRCFLFGQMTARNKGVGLSTKTSKPLVQPDKVFFRYMRTSALFDLVTGFPMQWVIMAIAMECSTEAAGQGLQNVRFLRIARVSRVVKIFNLHKMQAYIRRIKRQVPNTSVLQLIELFCFLAFLNHLWTCLTWFIKSSDDISAFEDWQLFIGVRLNESSPVDAFTKYSVAFQHTLQILFSINTYVAGTAHDAWFGAITSCLSVFISATVLSKILDIWQSINKRQIELDEKINAVKRFVQTFGIQGDLREYVLDFFDFRFSIPFGDFEKHLLDELPVDIRGKVVTQLFPGALKSCGMFRGVSEAFFQQLILKLARKPLRTMPGQVIVAQGHVTGEMYLIKSGSVCVSSYNQEKKRDEKMSVLMPGTTFGESSLWIEARSLVTVTSNDFCQLYVITAEDLQQTLKIFPEYKHLVASNAISQCLRTRSLCPGLAGISAESADQLAKRMCYEKVEFRDGECLAVAGMIPTSAYLLKSGKVMSSSGDSSALSHFGGSGSKRQMRAVGLTELFCCQTMVETITAKGKVVAYRCSLSMIADTFREKPKETNKLQKCSRKEYAMHFSQHIARTWVAMSSEMLLQHYQKLEAAEEVHKVSEFFEKTQADDEAEGQADEEVSFRRSKRKQSVLNMDMTAFLPNSLRVDSRKSTQRASQDPFLSRVPSAGTEEEPSGHGSERESPYNSLNAPGRVCSSGEQQFSRTNSDDSVDGPVTHYQQATAGRDN